MEFDFENCVGTLYITQDLIYVRQYKSSFCREMALISFKIEKEVILLRNLTKENNSRFLISKENINYSSKCNISVCQILN